jgi:hypothetical protein
MQTPNGTVPHFVRVQLGELPDPRRDGQACIYVPLGETPQGVGTRLAEVARAMILASKSLGSSDGSAFVTDVDGVPCRIRVVDALPKSTREEDLTIKLASLVVPQGWRPA